MSLTLRELHVLAVKAAPGRVEGRSAFCGRVEQHGLCRGVRLDETRTARAVELRGHPCSCPCHAPAEYATERRAELHLMASGEVEDATVWPGSEKPAPPFSPSRDGERER